MDHGNTSSEGGTGRGKGDRLAVEQDCSSVRSIQPGEEVHKSGFACAIFAQDRVNLAGMKVYTHPVNGGDARKGFREFPCRESGGAHGQDSCASSARAFP